MKNHEPFITVFTIIRWVKPARRTTFLQSLEINNLHYLKLVLIVLIYFITFTDFLKRGLKEVLPKSKMFKI